MKQMLISSIREGVSDALKDDGYLQDRNTEVGFRKSSLIRNRAAAES